ncbi:hypothetical protein FACS1894163_13180 [Spirochaetia bacterium]|nr:hypothetical protein FACS1894163_13180 [Spirochaetia bacterium]
MSHSAFVSCNCRKNGKFSCEHEDMKLANEYLTNAMGMSDFKYAIELFNDENYYPILSKYLPDSNDGFVPVEYSQELLHELINLENERRKYEVTLLFEETTNELKASSIAFTLKQFAFTEYNKNIYALSRNGFFIYEKVVDKEKNKYSIVFRSNKFIQRKISEKAYEFIDQKNGYSYKSSIKLHPFEADAIEDYTFKTTKKLVKIQDEYDSIIESLKKLANLSMESGNPICWL